MLYKDIIMLFCFHYECDVCEGLLLRALGWHWNWADKKMKITFADKMNDKTYYSFCHWMITNFREMAIEESVVWRGKQKPTFTEFS